MGEEEFRALLASKGYGNVKVKDFAPNFYDPMHTHDVSIMGLVVEGEITLEWDSGETTYAVGDYCDFAAGTPHAERTGDSGATLVLGYK
jgi:quercetin dioxygenase-like cupin family protein